MGDKSPKAIRKAQAQKQHKAEASHREHQHQMELHQAEIRLMRESKE